MRRGDRLRVVDAGSDLYLVAGTRRCGKPRNVSNVQHGDRHGARGKTDGREKRSAIEIAGKIQAAGDWDRCRGERKGEAGVLVALGFWTIIYYRSEA